MCFTLYPLWSSLEYLKRQPPQQSTLPFSTTGAVVPWMIHEAGTNLAAFVGYQGFCPFDCHNCTITCDIVLNNTRLVSITFCFLHLMHDIDNVGEYVLI